MSGRAGGDVRSTGRKCSVERAEMFGREGGDVRSSGRKCSVERAERFGREGGEVRSRGRSRQVPGALHVRARQRPRDARSRTAGATLAGCRPYACVRYRTPTWRQYSPGSTQRRPAGTRRTPTTSVRPSNTSLPYSLGAIRARAWRYGCLPTRPCSASRGPVIPEEHLRRSSRPAPTSGCGSLGGGSRFGKRSSSGTSTRPGNGRISRTSCRCSEPVRSRPVAGHLCPLDRTSLPSRPDIPARSAGRRRAA
jgi:hypothetical protein